MNAIAAARRAATPNNDFSDSADNVAWLPDVINVALHLFLVGSLIAFAYGIVMLVRERKDQVAPRAMAMFIGALIVVGTQASGRSYSDFIIDSLGTTRAPSFGIFGAVVPAFAGLLLGYYFTRGARQSSERAIRVMVMIGTLAITQFALMYAVAVENSGSQLDAGVTPNVSFVVGLGLWLVLNLGIKNEAADDRNAGLMAAVAERISGRSQNSPSGASRFHQKDGE